MNSSSEDDSLFVTGRRAKQTLRKDMALYVEYNTIELDGIILKRVNTAMIDNKKTTYFKCKNMKTPYRITGVCHFSGRIKNFPDNLEIEILNEHNPNCSYLKKTGKNVITSIYNKLNQIRQEFKNSHKTRPVVKKTNKKKKKQREYLESESSEHNDETLLDNEEFKIPFRENKLLNLLKIPEEIDSNSDLKNSEIYIELWTEADLLKEREVALKHPNIFQNLSL
jgi:hypothetical protein